MCTPPAGISEADWLSWPAGARKLIMAQQEELVALQEDNEQLRMSTDIENCTTALHH